MLGNLHLDEMTAPCVFDNSFAQTARRAGVRFRCHDLCHAFAGGFLQAPGDIPALQAILAIDQYR